MSAQVFRYLSKHWLPVLVWTLLLLVVSFLLLYQLENIPAVWWDEGWTLSAARNWVERGHLGHYLIGEPTPPSIVVRFPVVVPIALSMHLLGVGIWQGRLPGAIYTLLTLALAFHLARKIYDRKTGYATLFWMLVMSPFFLHPLLIGRQVLAEMPMLFFLLGGYSLLWLALSRSPVWGVGAAIFFGVALHSKLQVAPFWIVSLGLAVWIALRRRQHRVVLILAEMTAGSILVAACLLALQNAYMPGALSEPALQKILFNTAVIVLAWPVRWQAFQIAMIFALPQLLGLGVAGWRLLRPLPASQRIEELVASPEKTNRDVLYAALWGVGVSWFGWYVFMAMSWARYLFPPYFIGSIFLAGYLGEITGGYDLRQVVRQTSSLLMMKSYKSTNVLTLAGLLILVILLTLAVSTWQVGLLLSDQPQPRIVAAFLTDHIPKDAVVETFESELIFLAPEVNFHFPSDLVSMQLVRKKLVNTSVTIINDSLGTEPDYLVVGPYARTWKPYDDFLETNLARLEADFGGYQIYRLRNASP